MNTVLTTKYNVAAPRYTSYPTMPYWDTERFTSKQWESSVKASFIQSNHRDGISLYIHLPFCESLCTYCGCNTRITVNHGVELPYIEAVLKEWRMYRSLMDNEPVIRELHLGGGTPTFFSAANLGLLISGILKDTYLHPKAEFSFEAHPGNTTVEHLQVLHDHGFRRLSLGIQDFDPAVQLIINRYQTLEQVREVTHAARRIGYTSVNYDLIYGLPLQTLNSLIRTMHLVSELVPDRIAFYSYAHVPWIKPGQRKFTEADLPDAPTKAKLYEIGRSLLKNYGYMEVGMDHFALAGDQLLTAAQNGELHRNFMGYTSQHTQLLIGLGVSSISDSWYAFAQNEKKLEDYLNAIELGVLPVFKGHIQTNSDLAVRKHILEIMCTGKTTWNYHKEPFEELAAGIERLEPLAHDGLIELCSWGLQVTQTGQRFLRNICMALDARLWADKPATQLFSMAV
ncbi:oxygen-independent coproporphyrinogen III oxidase [Mucilaginibacter conchicola]|uniref:Coproporphyrinogen-III oxidase n=1 Tax=Mucilaginibacter conchicola TaxID=2303333 RepID=A0A372NLX8_9SPHI|nr:oxygen-independent coproporphyrinogen III oxidase [Mucilaginibacter conchicola]RFZ89944.1 oxygen-independent coproporphyrinogen III oxidase [Mucilaginibacter conchicola]